MSMPPGPDPHGANVVDRDRDLQAMEGQLVSIKDDLLKSNLPEGLKNTLRRRINQEGGESAISNDHLDKLIRPLATPLSEARRLGQPDTRLTFEGQRMLYAAGILAFDVWDHDGHASSAILTDLVDMWTLREAGDMSKGRRRRWEMVKLLWIALRQRHDDLTFTIEEVSKLPYDSHRRVAATPRLSQVLMEMGVSAVHENPDHLNMDWFGEAGYHWWSTNEQIGEILESRVLEGLYRLLVRSLGIRAIELRKPVEVAEAGRIHKESRGESAIPVSTDALSEIVEPERVPVLHGEQEQLDLSKLWCPFGIQEAWPDSFVITYDGSRAADGFDSIALNWRGSNVTRIIEPPTIENDLGMTVLRIVTPIPTRTDIIGPAPVF